MAGSIALTMQVRLFGYLASSLCLLLLPALASAATPAYFDAYGLSAASPTVDVGAQPLGYPSGVISAVMRRDRILKKALQDSQQTLRVHFFRRGADTVGLLHDQKLDAALLGDMPTLIAASTGKVWIVGLVKQTSTAIVTKGVNHLPGLANKRIAYVEASSAHHTLLQGLASVGMAESQVQLVPMGVADMPAALENGSVDAFAAWEPATTIAMSKGDPNRIVFRGQSSDYFVLQQDFVQQFPKAALQLTASFYRSLDWMRRSSGNLNKAAVWAMADTAAFSGTPVRLSARQIASITRREILDIPSAPTLLFSRGVPPLQNEYDFLSKLGKLPPGAQWERVEKAFSYDGLAQVLMQARAYRLRDFDYED